MVANCDCESTEQPNENDMSRFVVNGSKNVFFARNRRVTWMKFSIIKKSKIRILEHSLFPEQIVNFKREFSSRAQARGFKPRPRSAGYNRGRKTLGFWRPQYQVGWLPPWGGNSGFGRWVFYFFNTIGRCKIMGYVLGLPSGEKFRGKNRISNGFWVICVFIC